MGTLFTAVLLFYGIKLTAYPIGIALLWIRNGFNIRRTIEDVKAVNEMGREKAEERCKQMERWSKR